jgi:hypothetical protein
MSHLQKSTSRRAALSATRDLRHGIEDCASQALESAIERGESHYDRARTLAAFYRLPNGAIDAETTEAAGAIMREISRALRAERARMSHWSYDLNRHIGLMIAYRREKARAEDIARRQRESGGRGQKQLSAQTVAQDREISSAP